jgi:putative ABC transport system permease protein
VPGVAKAVGSVDTSNVALFTASGSRVGGGGAPTQVTSAVPEPFSAVDYVEGHAPENAGEVALLKSTADDKGIKVGDTVSIVGNGPRRSLKVVGLGNFGGVTNVGGFVLVLVTLPEAQQLADEPGQYNSILVAADDGVSQTQLRDRIRAVSPPTVNVRTGEEQADEDVSDIHDALGS